MGGIRPSSKGEEKEKEPQPLRHESVPCPDSIGHWSVPAYPYRVVVLIYVPRVDYKPSSTDCKLFSGPYMHPFASVFFTSSERPTVDDVTLPSIRDESPAEQKVALAWFVA